MRSIILAGVAAIALVGFVSNANATGRGNDDRPTGIGTGIGIGTGTGIGTASATANPTAIGIGGHQQQGQVQGQQTEVTTNQQQQTRVRATGGRARASTGPVTVGPQNVALTVGGDSVQYERGGRQVGALYGGSAIPPQCGFAFNAGGANQNGSGLLGFSFETESCRKDRLANRLAALGNTAAGIALLCTMGEIRDSMAAAGTPCPGTQQPAPVMASVAAPLSGASVQPVMTTPLPAATPVATSVPDFCYTLADARERRRYATACGFAGS